MLHSTLTVSNHVSKKQYNSNFSYRSGSVVVDSELIFANATSVPETTEVANTLVEASNNSSFDFPLNASSVVASSKNSYIFACHYET